MLSHRPIYVVLGACSLLACTTPVANHSAVVVPVFEVRHSANKDAATYARLGKYHHDRGNIDLAREAYLHAITLDSRQLPSRNALAVIDADEGRLDEAVVLLKSVVADFPALAYPISNLGYLYYLQGQFDNAVTVLESAVTLDPASERARSNLRLAKAAAGSQEELAKLDKSISEESRRVNAGVPILSDVDRANSTPAVAAPQTAVASLLSGSIASVQSRLFLNAMTESRFDIVKTTANVFDLKVRQPELKVRQSPLAPPPSAPEAAGMVAQRSKSPIPFQPAKASHFDDAFVEITNGNGVQGFAGRLRLVLVRQGFVIARLSNARPYIQEVTEIQYRAGYENQATLLRAALHDEHVVLHAMQSTGAADIKLVLGKTGASHMLADAAIVRKVETTHQAVLTGT